MVLKVSQDTSMLGFVNRLYQLVLPAGVQNICPCWADAEAHAHTISRRIHIHMQHAEICVLK
jgi:hypothetical protein